MVVAREVHAKTHLVNNGVTVGSSKKIKAEEVLAFGGVEISKNITTVNRTTRLWLSLTIRRIVAKTTRGNRKDHAQQVQDASSAVKRVTFHVNVQPKEAMIEVASQTAEPVTSVVKKVISLVSVKMQLQVAQRVEIATSVTSLVTLLVTVPIKMARMTEVATSDKKETMVALTSEVVREKVVPAGQLAGTKIKIILATMVRTLQGRTTGTTRKRTMVGTESRLAN